MFAERVQRVLESEARRSLASALSPVPGSKALLVDDTLFDTRLSLVRPLHLFTNEAFMREHGVRAIAPLSATTTRAMDDALDQPSIVIIIRGVNAAAARQAVTTIRQARERTARKLSESALKHSQPIPKPPRPPRNPSSSQNSTTSSSQTDSRLKCLVLTTPRRSKIVEKVLKSASLADVPVAELRLGFLPFDADLVTLDWPEAHRQIVLDGDNSAILACASALSALSDALHVNYVTVRSAGAAATAVAEDLLETQGQRYPRGSQDASAMSTASSVTSSAGTLTNRARAAFAGGDLFAQDDASVGGAATQEPGAKESVSKRPTLAGISEMERKRRSVRLVIIDRGVDVVTPLLTQWTYEGLLDEAVGLHNNMMDLPISSIVSEDAISMLSADAAGTKTVRKELRGNVDRIFGQLRDLNYWSAARQLTSVASSVRDYYDKRPKKDDAEISQMKDYVKGLREVKSEHSSAAVHTAILSEISARTFDCHEFKRRFELEREVIEGGTSTGRRVYITDAIARGESLSHVVRLCCLWSVTSGGIDGDELEFIKREMLANFGLGVLKLLANLERVGMLVRSKREVATNNLSWIPLPRLGGSETPSITGSMASGSGSDDSRRYSRAADYSWQFARAALRLMTDFDPEKEVKDGSGSAVAAPYSGYTPLTVRLIEAGVSAGGWTELPPIVGHTNLLPPGHATVEHCAGEIVDRLRGEDRVDAVVLFVGGVARAEASAVRLAARAAGMRTLITTTAVMGPDEFVLSLSECR